MSVHVRKTAWILGSARVKKERGYQCSCEKDRVGISECSCGGKNAGISVHVEKDHVANGEWSCEKDRVDINECSCEERTQLSMFI